VTAPVDTGVDALAEALSGELARIRDQYTILLSDEFRGLGWWGSRSTDVWSSAAVPLVRDAVETAAELAAVMVDAQIALLDPGYEPDGFDPAGVYQLVRSGVQPETVYGRSLAETWPVFGRGGGVEEAVSAGLDRLSSTLALDVERAADHATLERFANANRVVGYRRVPTGARSCALCLVASTQLYRKRELKPIHPHCRCRVSPVLSFESPALTLDRAMLDAVHAEVQRVFGVSARDARRLDYRKIMMVRNHSETGPQLTFSDHKFTGRNALRPREGT
jgi:hypothetical protein